MSRLLNTCTHPYRDVQQTIVSAGIERGGQNVQTMVCSILVRVHLRPRKTPLTTEMHPGRELQQKNNT